MTSATLEDGGDAAAAADSNAAGDVSRSGSKGSANGGTSTGLGGQNAVLQRLFYVFEHDPKGAVHRAWGITLLFMVAFFVISVIESTYLYSTKCVSYTCM
jgi:hypothetical protein